MSGGTSDGRRGLRAAAHAEIMASRMNERPRANGTRIVDNERVLITEWRFAPGSETGWHVHAHDYAVTYLTAATHLIETRSSNDSISRAAGETYFRRAGVEHNVINTGTEEVVFIEVEIK